MLKKRITTGTLACDGRCDKAWGINGRPSRKLSKHPDDYVFLGDDELGTAPPPGKTVDVSDGGDMKPSAVALTSADGDRMNKWCDRSCERSTVLPTGVELESAARGRLPNLERPVPNLGRRRVGHPLCDPDAVFSVEVVGEPLQDWYNRVEQEWFNAMPQMVVEGRAESSSERLWTLTADQMMWVRDQLTHTIKAQAYVIGMHRSKSCVLPVYQLVNREAGLMVVLRCNFYDWKVSVVSQRPVAGPFYGLAAAKESDLKPCYFEGFPESLVFVPHVETPQEIEGPQRRSLMQWSAAPGTREEVWTLMFLIAKHLGIR